MIRMVLILTLLVTLSGCGHASSTTVQRESVTARASDKVTRKIITEKSRTVVNVSRSDAQVQQPLTNLIEAGAIEARQGDTTVRVVYDDQTGMITATGVTEARQQPVDIERVTVVEENQKAIDTTTDLQNQSTTDIETAPSLFERLAFWIWLAGMASGLFMLYRVLR